MPVCVCKNKEEVMNLRGMGESQEELQEEERRIEMI